LLKALAQAQSVVERRNTIPILANVLIEAEGNQVSFRATDLDIEVVDRAPAMVERAGATTVSAVMLHEIVRKLPDGALVNLAEDAASGRLTIMAGPVDLQPGDPAEGRLSGDGDQRIFLQLLGQGAGPAAVRQGEIRDLHRGDAVLPERRLHACQPRRRRQGPRCVATDGHRLARIDAPLPEGAEGMPGVIVPRKTVGELRKLLDDEATIAVSVSETKVRFATPAIT
jgi:DNA polymerase-3 subunit beta